MLNFLKHPLFVIPVVFLSCLLIGMATGNAREDTWYHENPVKKIERFVIADDFGGSVQDYIAAITYIKKEGYGIKLDGGCVSACTLMLAKQLNLDVCATKNAWFGIHHPFGVGVDLTGNRVIIRTLPMSKAADELWNSLFLGVYPDWVKKIIEGNGGAPDVNQGALPSEILRIENDEVLKNIPTCME